MLSTVPPPDYQVRLRSRPCSTYPTSSPATRSTAISPPSPVSTQPLHGRPRYNWDLKAQESNSSCLFFAGFIPGAGISLQKQLEHANQQSGFTDAVSPPRRSHHKRALMPHATVYSQLKLHIISRVNRVLLFKAYQC